MRLRDAPERRVQRIARATLAHVAPGRPPIGREAGPRVGLATGIPTARHVDCRTALNGELVDVLDDQRLQSWRGQLGAMDQGESSRAKARHGGELTAAEHQVVAVEAR